MRTELVCVHSKLLIIVRAYADVRYVTYCISHINQCSPKTAYAAYAVLVQNRKYQIIYEN